MQKIEDAVDNLLAMAKLVEPEDAKAKMLSIIKDLLNQEATECLAFSQAEKDEWNDTAVRVSFIVGNISKKIEERIKNR